MYTSSKNKIIFLLLINLLSAHIVLPTKQTSTFSSKKITDFLVETAMPIGIASLYFATFSNNTTQQQLKNQLAPKKLFKNFCAQYLLHMIATISHELGHAIMSKVLNNDPIQINIGGNKQNKHLMNLGPLRINGFNPKLGYSTFTKPSKKQHAAIYLAGGISGALTIFSINNIINTEKKECELNNLLDPIILEQAFNTLIPISKNSDAAQIWKTNLNVSDKRIKTASEIQPALFWIAEFLITCQNSSTNTNILDKFALFLINHNLSGFFRFYV